MAVVKPYISKIAEEFWNKVGKKNPPPYDISGAVNLLFPLDIVSLSELSLLKIQNWLEQRGVTLPIYVDNRNIHGFILTFRGGGFVFINGTDPENERRYTIAHETSHYILDYKIPRDKAIKKIGSKILEVIDGYRPPTNEERVDGLLSSVNIEPYTHLLEMTGDGAFNNVGILQSENNADALATELLAPNDNVIKEVLKDTPNLSFHVFQARANKILLEKYKLPVDIAKEYSTRLSYSITGGPSLMKKIGF